MSQVHATNVVNNKIDQCKVLYHVYVGSHIRSRTPDCKIQVYNLCSRDQKRALYTDTVR